MKARHINRTIATQINIYAEPELIWDNITNVKIEQFSDPLIFKLLDIPKPLRAEINFEGVGGSRTAYFDNNKKFLQQILTWEPMKEYSFSFNPERGFKVLYIFELSEGVFRIPTGAYFLYKSDTYTVLKLITNYSIDSRLFYLFNWPAKIILKAFQKYLLSSIKKNSE